MLQPLELMDDHLFMEHMIRPAIYISGKKVGTFGVAILAPPQSTTGATLLPARLMMGNSSSVSV